MNEPVLLRARFGAFRVDESEGRLSRNGDRIDLSPRAFSVLCELLRGPGQLVPEEALLDRVWGHRHVSESVVRTVVSQLRQALGDDPRYPRFVETTPRRGYRFIAEVATDSDFRPRDIRRFASPSAPLVPAAPSQSLFGRESALERLREAWSRAVEGRHQFVLVGGDAGIGKSTLVDRFLASLPADVARTVGQCVEHHGAAEPYMPILEALNGLCRAADDDAVRTMLRHVAPSWLLQMPWLLDEGYRDTLRQEAAGASQHRMLRELGELFDRARGGAPLVVILEDMHWADHATVQALGYLMRRRGSSPVLVIATYRATELIVQQHPLATLRHEWRLHRLCEEISLSRLAERDVGDWLEHRFGGRPPDSFIRALHSHTSGLPLFAAHVIADWAVSGELGYAEGTWRVPNPETASVPSSISSMIDQQIQRLTPDERRLLEAASVGGVEFSCACLAAVVTREPADVEAGLVRLCDQLSWLCASDARPEGDGSRDSRYAFRHALCRQVILQGLSASQSIAWHRAWASVLEGLEHGDPANRAASVALHLERGHEPGAAAGRLVAVSTQAIERGAAHEAIQIARRGLSLLTQTPDRTTEQELRLVEALALTRLHVVSEPEVAQAFERAAAFDDIDSPASVRAAHGRWWVLFSRGELDDALQLAQRMCARGQRSGDPLEYGTGLGATGMTLAMRGEVSAARSTLEAALEAQSTIRAEAFTAPFVQHPAVEASDILALVSWISGDFAAAREHAEHAVDLAVSLRHPPSEVTALYVSACLHALAEEFEVVESLVDRLYKVIERHTLSMSSSGFDWLRGRALVERGLIDEGLDLMRRAAASARRCGLLVTLDGFYYHYAEACRVAGDLSACVATSQEGIQFARTTGARLYESGLWRQLALAHTARGDCQDAEAALRRAIVVAREQGAVFHEVMALACAQERGWSVDGPERLASLLWADEPTVGSMPVDAGGV
jgi:DNA-binding winged helix-turn-helix (wHTH) protein/tetratricopeptide (TPR) repeat protein